MSSRTQLLLSLCLSLWSQWKQIQLEFLGKLSSSVHWLCRPGAQSGTRKTSLRNKTRDHSSGHTLNLEDLVNNLCHLPCSHWLDIWQLYPSVIAVSYLGLGNRQAGSDMREIIYEENDHWSLICLSCAIILIWSPLTTGKMRAECQQ